MVCRQIGQELFAFVVDPILHDRSSLGQLSGLVAVDIAPKGEPAWPRLTLFRTLLSAVWYDLSDVRLAGAFLGVRIEQDSRALEEISRDEDRNPIQIIRLPMRHMIVSRYFRFKTA